MSKDKATYTPRVGDIVTVRATIQLDGLTPMGNVRGGIDRSNGKGGVYANEQVYFDPSAIVSVEERPIQVGDVFAHGTSRCTIVSVFEAEGRTYTAYISSCVLYPVVCHAENWPKWGYKREQRP
jgi:hypothetical protein